MNEFRVSMKTITYGVFTAAMLIGSVLISLDLNFFWGGGTASPPVGRRTPNHCVLYDIVYDV